MKELKNNLWNKIFHSRELREYNDTRSAIIGWNKQLNEDIARSKTLQELIDVHKHAWEIGYRNENIAPLPWGMFRCERIEELDLGSLYLGGVYGMWTFNGVYWEAHREDKYGVNGFNIDPGLKCYDIVMRQYRRHLLSNINAIYAKNIKGKEI